MTTNLFTKYVEHGWAITRIEPGQKRPTRRAWNTREQSIVKPEQAQYLECAGLCHAYSGTAAFDVDHYDSAKVWLTEQGIDIDDLFHAPDAVQIVSGEANRGKLLYALPEPLPSKSFADGAFELRCSTSAGKTAQDLLPPSKHPSGREYRWEGDWRKLPPFPPALLEIWKATLAPRKAPATETPIPPAELNELQALIEKRDPDCGYDEWIKIGMVIHHETEGSEDGLALWNDWSENGEKYVGLQDLQSHWGSFGSSENPVTIAYLYSTDVASVDEFDVLTDESDMISVIGDDIRVSVRLLRRVMAVPTEDSVAELFEACFKDELRFCAPLGGWLHWDGARWDVESTGLALDYCRQLARKANWENQFHISKKSFAKGVEDLARVSRQFATRPEQWDVDEFLLNTPDFTFDLRTGETITNRPEDYITKVTQHSPKAGAMPVFDQFMLDITQEDKGLIAYHQRSIGACLSGAINEHFLLFWYGEGRNGKNTLGDLVCKILGDYAKSIPTDTLMSSKQERHPTELANLRGLRLVSSSEVPEGSFWNESLIKRLTGDETISARFMRQDYFVFNRTHKHLIYGNHRPQLRVVDKAICNRLHIVPFRAEFVDEKCDPAMGEKLQAEAPQILNWIIEGHQQWMADGQKLLKCAAVEAETNDYFDSQSTTETWLQERCVEDASAETRSSVLYRDYWGWKDARGEKPVSQSRWSESMRRFPKRKSNGVWYQGVRLRDVVLLEPTPWEISNIFNEFADLL